MPLAAVLVRQSNKGGPRFVVSSRGRLLSVAVIYIGQTFRLRLPVYPVNEHRAAEIPGLKRASSSQTSLERRAIATANFRMSRTNSLKSYASQSAQIMRASFSRAASTASVIALPPSVMKLRAHATIFGPGRRATRETLSSVATWRLTVVVAADLVANSTIPMGPSRAIQTSRGNTASY
jgi:hypothetical protein